MDEDDSTAPPDFTEELQKCHVLHTEKPKYSHILAGYIVLLLSSFLSLACICTSKRNHQGLIGLALVAFAASTWLSYQALRAIISITIAEMGFVNAVLFGLMCFFWGFLPLTLSGIGLWIAYRRRQR